MMSGPAFLRKYNTLTITGSTAIRIPIIKRGVVDFAVGADWTPAAGDCKINIDGAGPANVTNLPTAVASGNGAYWEFVLTAAELSCKQAIVTVVDAATKAVEDQCFLVETFGNASAMYQADLSAANLPANVTQLLGTAWLTPGTAGTPDVNTKLVGGTSQTGRDLGASVIVASGTVTTVTNQLTAAQIATGVWQDATAGDFTTASSIGKSLYTSGVVPGAAGGLFIAGTNAATAITTGLTARIIGTVDTVTTVTNQLTASQIATGVWTDTTAGDFTTSLSVGKSLMNGVTLGTGLTVARCTLTDTLTTYTGNTVQTGDAFARLGAPAGASAAADIAAINAKTTNLPAAPASTTNITAGTITTVTNLTNAPTNGDLTLTMKVSVIAAATAATPTVTAGAVTDKTGYSLATPPLDAAATRAALGMASANLDTQLGTLATSTGLTSAVSTIAGYFTTLQTHGDSTWTTITAAGVRTAVGLASANLDTQLSGLFTTALTESYATDGSAMTVAQALHLILATTSQYIVSGTTITAKKLDGTTTAATYTMDDATNPTQRIRTG